jgi:hypothetical protein
MFGRPMLPIDSYDRAEALGTQYLSIAHIMAFQPRAFEKVGWPTRVKHEAELLRYVDHNFEPEVTGLYEPGAEFAPAAYRNSFTYDEMELVARIRNCVAALTGAWFARSVRPASNILVQAGPYRIMHRLASAFDMPQLSVFEVGPGAGYLGAMLATTGHKYASYDVTQALYLWQSRLLQSVVGPEFLELAALDAPPWAFRDDSGSLARDENLVRSSRVAHLPWWFYTRLLRGTRLRADVVYSNSNLGEMSRVATRQVLQISRYILADSSLGIFCFVSKGNPDQLSHEQIDEEFRIFGYHKVLEAPFSAYALTPDVRPSIEEAFADGVPSYNPSGRGGSISAAELTPLKRDESPLDLHLTEWYYGWKPPFTD